MDSALIVVHLGIFSWVYADIKSLQGAFISWFSQSIFQNIFEQYILLLNFEPIIGIIYPYPKTQYHIMVKGIGSEVSLLGFES